VNQLLQGYSNGSLGGIAAKETCADESEKIPHQFRTRNDLTETQRKQSISDDN
jgi:hypothetical protein